MQKTTMQSLLLTLLVVMACNVLFVFLFAIWKATFFQSHPLIVGFFYGLIYPSIYVAAMWAILGPGKMVYRQLVGMVSLLLFFGVSCAVAWLLVQQFDIPAFADEIARTMSRRTRFRMIQHIATTSCSEIILEVFLAVPFLFITCQLPCVVYCALSRKQLRRENERPRENVTIQSLFFLTAMMAFSFACISASGKNPPGQIALSLLVQIAFASASFVLVCWPLMNLSLADHQTARPGRSHHVVDDSRRNGFSDCHAIYVEISAAPDPARIGKPIYHACLALRIAAHAVSPCGLSTWPSRRQTRRTVVMDEATSPRVSILQMPTRRYTPGPAF